MKSIIILSFLTGIFSVSRINQPIIYNQATPPDLIITSPQDTSRYVFKGAEACATKCHNNEELGFQYNDWKNSRHSKSYESLTGEMALVYSKKARITENPWESSVCLKCHITADGVDLLSMGSTYKKQDGVTCEACHKGEFTPKTYLPKEEDCLKCHNNSVHEVAAFDFKERCLKILHPRPHVIALLPPI